MASLTIRNLPDEIVAQIKDDASAHGRSMEAHLRVVLRERFGHESKSVVLDRIRRRWSSMTPGTAEQVDAWIRETRERGA